ncbi:MAG: fructokinase [Microbacteriaceae bacterium]|nr:fructokinase [Microbacteriaceae bacterium]
MTDPRNSHVVVVGDALIDEIRDGEGSREFVGGAALNVAVGLTRLGVPATLVAMVGDDPDGDSIRAFLARFGVRLIATEAPRGTARAMSVREGGEPHYEFNDASVNRAIVFDDAAREAIAGAPLVVVSCYPFDRDERTDALLDAVDDPEHRLLVDPNPRPGMMSDVAAFVRNLDRIAPRVRLIKIGDEDAALLYGVPLEQAAARLRRDGAGAVLATAGRRGADLVTAEGTFHADIADLAGPVVDTMGAGDATLAALTDALLRADRQGAGDSLYWEGALQNAMIIAGATCRAEGALLQLP